MRRSFREKLENYSLKFTNRIYIFYTVLRRFLRFYGERVDKKETGRLYGAVVCADSNIVYGSECWVARIRKWNREWDVRSN